MRTLRSVYMIVIFPQLELAGICSYEVLIKIYLKQKIFLKNHTRYCMIKYPDKNVRNWNSCALLIGMLNGAAAMKKCGSSSKKLELPLDPAIPFLDIYTYIYDIYIYIYIVYIYCIYIYTRIVYTILWKEFKAGIPTDICAPLFKAALFTIAKRWKQPKCPSMDEWINKIWYIHTMEYYSGLKNKEMGLPWWRSD